MDPGDGARGPPGRARAGAPGRRPSRGRARRRVARAASPSWSRTTSTSAARSRAAAPRRWGRRPGSTRTSPGGCAGPGRCCSAARTWTSWRWGRPPRPPRSAAPTTRTTCAAAPAAAAGDRPPRSPRTRRRCRWAPTPAARSASPRRSAGCWAWRRRRAWCRCAGWCRSRPVSTGSARWPGRCATSRSWSPCWAVGPGSPRAAEPLDVRGLRVGVLEELRSPRNQVGVLARLDVVLGDAAGARRRAGAGVRPGGGTRAGDVHDGHLGLGGRGCWRRTSRPGSPEPRWSGATSGAWSCCTRCPASSRSPRWRSRSCTTRSPRRCRSATCWSRRRCRPRLRCSRGTWRPRTSPTRWPRPTPTAGRWSPTWSASRPCRCPAAAPPTDRMPVGTMLMGRPRTDHVLLGVAAALEAAGVDGA